MNRRAKGLRTAGGIAILFNIFIFFLPMAEYTPRNYPVEKFSQWDYVCKVFSEEAPYGAVSSSGRFMWMFFLILLPIILSLVAAVWGMAGNDRQIVSSILIFVVLGLYMVLYLSIGSYFPDQDYRRDIAGLCNLLCCITASVFALLALLSQGGKAEEPILKEIPQVQELKQEQVRAKYNILTADEASYTPSDHSVSVSTVGESQTTGQSTGHSETASKQTVPKQTLSLRTDSMQQNNSPQSTSPKQKALSYSDLSQQPVLQPETDVPEQESALPVLVIPPYVPGPPKGVMVGLTGIYAGAVIPFRDGESIRLGRLANNDLVFEGQDKVSRNHCYIKWDGAEQKFMLKDSSSNGTFVNGSEDCLPQNIEIEIPIGSVIAIGDDRNTFRLE